MPVGAYETSRLLQQQFLLGQSTWTTGFDQGKIWGRWEALEEAAKLAEAEGYPLLADKLRQWK